MRDLIVRNMNSIFLLVPVTEAGRDWISNHIPDDALTWGKAIVVEHRYIGDIVEGAIADGLTVGR